MYLPHSESVRSTLKHSFFCSSHAQFWDKMVRVPRSCVFFAGFLFSCLAGPPSGPFMDWWSVPLPIHIGPSNAVTPGLSEHCNS